MQVELESELVEAVVEVICEVASAGTPNWLMLINEVAPFQQFRSNQLEQLVWLQDALSEVLNLRARHCGY